MDAVEINLSSNYVKMKLPNGNVVDILSPVFEEIKKWVQVESSKPESGGYIVGYQHKNTGNISLEEVSHPYLLDVKSRVRFDIRDPRHQHFLRKAKRNRSYYMGVWHTHPQKVPVPSGIDWKDWNETLKLDTTGCQFVFFIIAGTEEWRIWAGDLESGIIQELMECEKNSEGLYLKEGLMDEEFCE